MSRLALHDGSEIDIDVRGAGPTLLIPVNPLPIEGPQSEQMRRWGADPALGRTLIDGLADDFRVVAFDYEGHVLDAPKPETLTPDTVTADILAVADAVGADRFGYYGYSWLAMAGLQLGIRTDRLSALAMGGYPPIDGPYAEMLSVTTATHEMATAGPNAPAIEGSSDEFDWSAVEVSMSPAQTGQFATLYAALQGFDDHAAQARLRCPRLCFAGSADEIDYGPKWGGVHVSMAGPLVRERAQLESLGWQVRVLDGLEHTQAMQAAHVLPILRPWLATALR